jgi:hypothetical protein
VLLFSEIKDDISGLYFAETFHFIHVFLSSARKIPKMARNIHLKNLKTSGQPDREACITDLIIHAHFVFSQVFFIIYTSGPMLKYVP